MTDTQIAALEAALRKLNPLGVHAATIRALIAQERSGGEWAKVVAWLRADETWQAAVNCTMAERNSDVRNVCLWLAKVIEKGTI
jgi:hypothetical protein